LEKIGLSYGIKFTDLNNEEKDVLKEEVIKINSSIFGNIYRISGEIPELKNIESYSQIIDACGKNKKQGIGLSICLGEREQALKEGLELFKKYQDGILKGLEWIKKEGSIEMDYIQYIYTEDKNLKSFMGTLSSIGIDIGLLNPEKPVLALSKMDPLIKISGRTTLKMIQKGVNLGDAFEQASKSFNGSGGGHTIAAGAVIPHNNLDNFLNLVDEIVKEQINL
jgi:RecJ-like exonuclease